MVIIVSLFEKFLRINDIIKSFILTAYTAFSVHCKDIYNINLQNYKLAYLYKKLMRMLFFGGSAGIDTSRLLNNELKKIYAFI